MIEQNTDKTADLYDRLLRIIENSSPELAAETIKEIIEEQIKTANWLHCATIGVMSKNIKAK